MRNHVIFFSGGLSSFSAADAVKTRYPNDNIVLYFTDTLWENNDLYRFIHEVSDKLKLPLLTHSLGLTPIQLMFEQKLVFNSLKGVCSRVLKIEVASRFLRRGIVPKIEKWYNKHYLKSENFSENAVLYFGIGIEEMHRQDAIIQNWKPFEVRMPLIEQFIDNEKILKKYEIRRPILYDYGFVHNNCNGRCIKAGQAHFRNLKWKMPEVFQKVMEQEHHLKIYVSSYHYIKNMESDGRDGFTEEVRQQQLKELDDAYRDYFYGKKEKPDLYIHPAASATAEYMKIQQYSFMKKTVKKETKPYPLRDFHYDTEKEGQQIDIFDYGGCGCFLDYGGIAE
ncbi:hypothetical protein AM501_09885 [Aneurinibacillus migulanus]|uniref:phosphoadenosine phosphosulfate reductase domain-containing protein n=1 Tax=Aneurinibacillus migulanus TaxID=47500 RepID=UPI0005BAA628|nr:phosphoadenosine phosphosulfate reductase family protein [Aneurinibacillus migulanus]KIV56454.1 hypothetical protein TS64_09300 [Aneurinibacillus migulanus]KPD08462.1 hypothetical protein AM501_09885 [Aneurinibacillus migulanus]